MSEVQALAVSTDWLNQSTQQNSLLQNSQMTVGNTGDFFNPQYCYPSWTYPVYISSPARPIKLSLAEVDRLRKAAKADAALRDILVKFTSQIEIIVAFE